MLPVADPLGKLHMLGAGWSITSSPTSPAAVAILLKVPWDPTNERIPMSLYLCDADGARVTIDERPVGLEQQFEVGRPPGLAPGTPIDASFQFTVPPLPLHPGRFQWRLAVGVDEFSISFEVRGT